MESSSNNYLLMPTVRLEVHASRALASSISTLDLDVAMPVPVTVSGRVLINGLTPQLRSGRTDGCVRVRFTHLDGLNGDSDWACTSDGYRFEVDLWSGVHRVRIESSSNNYLLIPTVAIEVVERLQVP